MANNRESFGGYLQGKVRTKLSLYQTGIHKNKKALSTIVVLLWITP
jgi:hypothetical protein